MQENKLFLSLSDFLCNFLVNCLNEIKSVKISVSWNVVCVVDTNGQIFCHFSTFNTLNCGSFKTMTELFKFWKVIEFGSMKKSSGPSENTGD